jgi:CheY-like chemotaxis protein
MPRILVVDNDSGVRQIIETFLQNLQFTVRLAENGQEAIDLYRAEKFDLVLLDMRMPAMDGPQTLVALKVIDPEVVCCFMSSSLIPSPDELAGAVGFLAKPFSLEDLRALIATNLGES